MTVRSLQRRFDDDTAYDRLMLESVVGADLLLRQLTPSSTDDLRGTSKSFARAGVESLGASARQAVLDELRPVLFATAWKLLDVMVEVAKELNSGRAPPARGWRITEKVSFVTTSGSVPVEPSASYPKFWTRVAKLYARLQEPRNAVIHRRFMRSSAGGLVPYSLQQRPLRTISVGEVDALARASYGLAEELVAGRPDARRCAALSWQLDELRGITKLTQISAGAPPDVRIVLVNLRRAGRRWRLDLKEIRDHLASQTAAGFADIVAYVPGTNRFYCGRLEDAPGTDSIEFPASRPPLWLRLHQ